MKSLKERIAELPKDSNVVDVFLVISKWENEAVKQDRLMEKTAKSGRLHYRCDSRLIDRSRSTDKTTSWICSYCGTKAMSDKGRCEDCGGPRFRGLI